MAICFVRPSAKAFAIVTSMRSRAVIKAVVVQSVPLADIGSKAQQVMSR